MYAAPGGTSDLAGTVSVKPELRLDCSSFRLSQPATKEESHRESLRQAAIDENQYCIPCIASYSGSVGITQ